MLSGAIIIPLISSVEFGVAEDALSVEFAGGVTLGVGSAAAVASDAAVWTEAEDAAEFMLAVGEAAVVGSVVPLAGTVAAGAADGVTATLARGVGAYFSTVFKND